MQTQQTPQVLAQPFAAKGDKNTIPNAATGTNEASLEEGFPRITETPINNGGVPPERKDFNGAMNLNSQFYFAFQNGWWPTFSKQVSDAIGGYPKDAVLWLFDSTKSRARILQSLIPNNTYNFNTDASYIGKYWKELAQDGRGLSIGQVVLSQSNLATDNPGCLPLWTGEYYVNASTLYPDFYAWVKSHPELCKTKAEYDSAIAAYGECPYYVVDEVEGSLRLPKLVNYIKSATAAEGITQSKAGLPNITGTAKIGGYGSYPIAIPETTGALGTYENGSIMTRGESGQTNDWGLSVDASKSSSIYGASDTVTPAHTTLYPWVYAFNAAVPASTAQAAEFAGALSGKANADLSNCPANYDYVVESYKDDQGNWYRKYKSGWVEQGGIATSAGEVTFLKPFANTNYSVQATCLYTNYTNWGFGINKTSASSFHLNMNIGSQGAMWEAKGMEGVSDTEDTSDRGGGRT